MQEWSIKRYTPAYMDGWDALVRESRQGTFLHMRGYMDYHSDRFHDCSIIASRKGRPDVILPANLSDEGILFSHQGLTYGGWLTPKKHFDGEDMLDVFEVWLKWCKDNDIRRIVYKPIPYIYHRLPAQEDLYALFRFGAEKTVVNLSSAVSLANAEMSEFNSQQKRNLTRGAAAGLHVYETRDTSTFFRLLEECLRERHGAAPVHTEEELSLLSARFPEKIRFFTCGAMDDKADAGVCIYDTGEVAHCQYIASSEKGRKEGALALLMNHLMRNVFKDRRWFDFGTSNENRGKILNTGLLRQKAGLGGCGVAYETYEIEI